jgi:hypothetical protein
MPEKMSGIEIWKMLKDKLKRYNLAAAEIELFIEDKIVVKPASTKKPDLVDAIEKVSEFIIEFVKKHMHREDNFSDETMAVLKEIVPPNDIPNGLKKMFGYRANKGKKVGYTKEELKKREENNPASKEEKSEPAEKKPRKKGQGRAKDPNSKRSFIENLIRESKHTSEQIFQKTMAKFPGNESSTRVVMSQVKKSLSAIVDKKTKILMAPVETDEDGFRKKNK